MRGPFRVCCIVAGGPSHQYDAGILWRQVVPRDIRPIHNAIGVKGRGGVASFDKGIFLDRWGEVGRPPCNAFGDSKFVYPAVEVIARVAVEIQPEGDAQAGGKVGVPGHGDVVYPAAVLEQVPLAAVPHPGIMSPSGANRIVGHVSVEGSTYD